MQDKANQPVKEQPRKSCSLLISKAMNREIQFRGKRADNGEWVEGFYVIMAEKHIIWSRSAIRSYYVIPETVGQFTGLLDKDGKKIFEGDKFTFGREHTYFVVYENAEFVCYHMNLDDAMGGKLKWGRLSRICDNDLLDFAKLIEVIGNIHDTETK